ncbi:hypothetical protein DRN63_04060 [Nanoarchaeota archaeon]|nr:MAG: hypothetical protein DRN63_04060 [Nanoarchaeota archaeon]
MRVGIKYCGGCNPSYRREKIEEFLRKNFKDVEFHYLSEGEEFDLVVCINGCKRACTDEVNCSISFDEDVGEDEVIRRFREVLDENFGADSR